ncbi:hypothetical protein [Streptomyces sp. DHE17-7]|uniref:hypothetical protein n=1 Tax=Streptomyces sp. DHE17-7 TaxID=2759949 RepID=UPI003FA75EBA
MDARRHDAILLALTVRNTGERSGTEVVQLYLHDPVASVFTVSAYRYTPRALTRGRNADCA